ncbi:MAG: hypothetical protein KDA51_09730, partial [Planctomycetales bacterium]|nr:hypothetical protein [Planctomycetales bacterium]
MFSVAILVVVLSAAGAAEQSDAVPNWIWAAEHQPGHVPQVTCYFRKTMSLPPLSRATLSIVADDWFEVYVNGSNAVRGTASDQIQTYDVSRFIRVGENVIAVKVSNREGQTAGLAG